MVDVLFDALIQGAGVLAAAGTTPDIAAIINRITAGLTPIFVPVATLGLTFFFILLLAGPILPEGVNNNKGYFLKVCLVLIAVGMMLSLLGWLSSLGTTTPAAMLPYLTAL